MSLCTLKTPNNCDHFLYLKFGDEFCINLDQFWEISLYYIFVTQQNVMKFTYWACFALCSTLEVESREVC